MTLTLLQNQLYHLQGPVQMKMQGPLLKNITHFKMVTAEHQTKQGLLGTGHRASVQVPCGPVTTTRALHLPHLADIHGIQLGQQDFREVSCLRVVVLYVFSLFLVQPLWGERGFALNPEASPKQASAKLNSKRQRCCSSHLPIETGSRAPCLCRDFTASMVTRASFSPKFYISAQNVTG